MKTVKMGSVVKLCYRGKVDDAEKFDPPDGCKEIVLEVGSGDVMKAFEESLLGMAPREKKTFTIRPEDAFGNRDERLKRIMKRSELPGDFSAGVGEMVAIRTDEGDQVLAMVKDTDAERVTFDLNHPLAGRRLTFEVEVEEIGEQPSP